MKSLDFVLGFASGLAGEELSAHWTRGQQEDMSPVWLTGLLVNEAGVIKGIITLAFNEKLGNFAELSVRTPNGVRKEVLEYRGAWMWPLQVLARMGQIPYRGRRRAA